MDNKKTVDEIKKKEGTIINHETSKNEETHHDNPAIKHQKDCRDNCMHCGFHCRYLND